MVTDARKIHLIEELLKTKSNKVLAEVETVLKGRRVLKRADVLSAHEFGGIISTEDAALMEAAIEDGCTRD